MTTREEKLQAFSRLLDIMDDLREKCPWDKKQTMNSLMDNTVEETYELLEAIRENNSEEIKKELGDILLHIIFYSKIASEDKSFDVGDVINAISEKLIFRHPHIYGNVEAETEEKVKENWEKLKLKEGRKSILEGVPKNLPAMTKAFRIQQKVKSIGFEFENTKQLLAKIVEEIKEFEEEKDIDKREMEMGDIIFSIINYSRFEGINPEEALQRTNKKFINRFQKLEKFITDENKKISKLSLVELDEIWNKMK